MAEMAKTVKVALERQPRYFPDGQIKPSIEADWPIVPRIGDDINFENPDICGVVRAVIWSSPTSVRIVVKEA